MDNMDNGLLFRLNEFAYLTCKLVTDLASRLALRILQSHLEPPTNFFPQFLHPDSPSTLSSARWSPGRKSWSNHLTLPT